MILSLHQPDLNISQPASMHMHRNKTSILVSCCENETFSQLLKYSFLWRSYGLKQRRHWASYFFMFLVSLLLIALAALGSQSYLKVALLTVFHVLSAIYLILKNTVLNVILKE